MAIDGHEEGGSGAGDQIQESIEAKTGGQGDVAMPDAPSNPPATAAAAAVTAENPQGSAENSKPDVDADGDADMDADADGEEDDTAADEQTTARNTQRDLLNLIAETSTYLCEYKEDPSDEFPLAANFQRLLNRRSFPDYFEVIKEPVAFSTVRQKVLKKVYTTFSEFVRDVALICHNAQVYNRPSAVVFGEAIRLREVFVKELERLVQERQITADEAKLPYLGEIPDAADDSPSPVPQDEEEDEDEDDEDEESNDDDSDDDGKRRRRRKGRLPRRGRGDDGEFHKKRGRPPKVPTPMESRVNNLLNGLRKPKNDKGLLRILPFEKLPDRSTNREYYDAIQEPVSMETITRRLKRKKYRSFDQALADVDTMFENAKKLHGQGTPIYQDAVELQKYARELADRERARPDDSFAHDEAKASVDRVVHNGEVYQVGDWVHLRNPNDLSKPIVAQIYRIWKDGSGQHLINTCWYYRPEQTVHRYDKQFWENEVFKTGQYRDHQVQEIVDRCFVMFFTRYLKGRPRGLPEDKKVYVCEARYNEEKFTFHRIKTWASCLPDEVREKDYEMEPWKMPIKVKKNRSPIAHLLRHDATERDPLPKPTWGSPNAPPLLGAVHKRPRDENDSPPPRPSPQPMAAQPQHMVQPDMTRRQSFRSDVSMGGTPNASFHQPAGGPVASHAPMGHPQNYTGQRMMPIPPPQAQPHLQQPMNNQPIHSSNNYIPPQTPHAAPQLPQQFQSPSRHHTVPAVAQPMYDNRSMTPTPAALALRAQMPVAHSPAQIQQQPAYINHGIPQHGAHYNAPPVPQVYTLPEAVDAAIPEDVRAQFQRDENGRVMFFTTPPVNRPHLGISEEHAGLGHSARFLADRKKLDEERRQKRKERDEEQQRLAAEELVRKKKNGATESQTADGIAQDKEAVAALSLLTSFVESMGRHKAELDRNMEGWAAEKAKWQAERKQQAVSQGTTRRPAPGDSHHL